MRRWYVYYDGFWFQPTSSQKWPVPHYSRLSYWSTSYITADIFPATIWHSILEIVYLRSSSGVT